MHSDSTLPSGSGFGRGWRWLWSLVLLAAGALGGIWAHERGWLPRIATAPQEARELSRDEHDAHESHGHEHGAPGDENDPDHETAHQPEEGDEPSPAHEDGAEHDEHAREEGHDHDHDETAVELTEQARGNIGLRVGAIGLTSFTRTLTMPAIVVERPGQSQVEVVAPLTGVVTRIHVIAGQAVAPGQLLFEVRLTHEELVQAQGEYLRTLEELDVVQREIVRLSQVAEQGAIAGKVLLEREYERQKLEGVLRAQEQAIALHGLTAERIASIRDSRKLLNSIAVHAPAAAEGEQPLWQVEALEVEPGRHISAGEAMCRLTNHQLLYVEGKAFQQDSELLNEVARKQADVCAVLESADAEAAEVCNLKVLYLASTIDPQTRLFSFFATLPNEVVRDDTTADGRRFVGWRFRPGERLQLKIPVETWSGRIVLPVEAVVQEGPESYVFREDGGHFHRCAVRVAYRDAFSVVLAERAGVEAGDRLALNSAQQLHLALKNRERGSGGHGHGHEH